jgi:hypothetical protein
MNNKLIDRISNTLSDILTSTLLIIIVMISFLTGIAIHLVELFDIYLAIGFQAVVLITSANSDILPNFTLRSGKRYSVIPLIMALCSFWYIFIVFDGLTHINDFNGIEFTIAFTKALGIGIVEYIFAFLFTVRNNKRHDITTSKQHQHSASIVSKLHKCTKCSYTTTNISKLHLHIKDRHD